ncbi:MAG TPA: hypothetical protein VEL48_05345, partial [Candidatus Acidoferrales bacterium]|nr:hypothetical protein [Candidatus Acidoferrales bacterium]
MGRGRGKVTTSLGGASRGVVLSILVAVRFCSMGRADRGNMVNGVDGALEAIHAQQESQSQERHGARSSRSEQA